MDIPSWGESDTGHSQIVLLLPQSRPFAEGLEVSHRITRRTTRPVARVVSRLDVADVDQAPQLVEVVGVPDSLLHDRTTDHVCHPQHWFGPADAVVDP